MSLHTRETSSSCSNGLNNNISPRNYLLYLSNTIICVSIPRIPVDDLIYHTITLSYSLLLFVLLLVTVQ